MKVTSTLIEAHVIRKKNDAIEFLLLKRAPGEKYPGLWQMVTGSIDKGEKAFQTASREIKEETGLTPKKFWVVPHINSFYSPEQDFICMVPVFVALVGNEKVIISDEHSEFKWAGKEAVKKLLAWPGQKKSVDIICDYFINKKSFLKFVEIEISE